MPMLSTSIMRSCCVALLAAATTTQVWALSPTPMAVSQGCSPTASFQARTMTRQTTRLFLSDSSADDMDPKTKLATDLQRLFDRDGMAYTVMVSDEQKGDDGKLTPEQLIAAIQQDSMFGEDFAGYCNDLASEGDVQILDIGKFSEDMESSEPLPKEDNLVIPGKGNYLVYWSIAEGITATTRVVVG